MEFKIGDRVKCIEENSSFNEGDIAKVVKIGNEESSGNTIFLTNIDQSERHVYTKYWRFEKQEKKGKEKPIDKHIVMQDDCKNFMGINDNYQDAENRAKELSGKVTVYRLVKVATVQSERKVVKVRPESTVKKGKARKK